MNLLGATFTLAWRHASHHRGRTLLLVLCVAAAASLPMASRALIRGFEASLRARAASTPLVAGAKGNRFDLVMAALYFRRADMPTVSMADFQALADQQAGVAIPVNVRFTARGVPIVATTGDYFQLHALSAAQGSLPLRLGDVVLGSGAARRLGLTGGALFSDQRELYDIAKPPALKMRVVGVLAPSGTIDDDAVFVDIKTAWILEGLSHGHADAVKAIPAELVLDRTPGNVAVSEALVDFKEVTDATLPTFHIHAESAALPLTAVIVVPRDDKSRTLIKARANAGKVLQVVPPAEVVEELLAYVLRLRTLLDGLSIVLAALTSVMIGLVTALSARVRARELATLFRIGASRPTIVGMFAAEIGMVILIGVVLGVAASALAATFAPALIKLL